MPDVSRAGSIGEVEGHQQRLGWIEPIGYDGEGVPYVLWICRHRHEIRDLREVCEGIVRIRPGPWRDRLRYIDPCDLQAALLAERMVTATRLPPAMNLTGSIL